jgi:mutator protein MutT
MPIRVVASVIEREGRLLVCERPAHKRHGGLWEFPGGKVEPGESDLEAVRRELREELDLDVVDVAPAEFSILDPGSPFLIAFVPVEIAGEPRCLEHAALAWVAEEEVGGLALAPSDRRYWEWRVGVGRDLGGGGQEGHWPPYGQAQAVDGVEGEGHVVFCRSQIHHKAACRSLSTQSDRQIR